MSWAAPCGDEEIELKTSTRLRKGPGRNYRVSRVTKREICVSFEQVSMDGRWTLVRFGKRKQNFGWVATSRLRSEVQEEAMASRPSLAPIGTGLGRQFAQLSSMADMRDTPSERSTVIRSLSPQALVLPLRMSRSGRWVEVRDSRGAVGWVEKVHVQGEMSFEELPVAEIVEMGGAAVPSFKRPTKLGRFVRVPSVTERRVSGPSDSVRATLTAGGGTFIPLLRLNSNGRDGFRRYDASALSVGASAALQLNGLGPFSARVSYDFGMIDGVTALEISDQTVGGTSHSASAMIGWAISLGGSVLIPEIGYGFDSTNIDPTLPDSGIDVLFISTETHAALIGLRFQAPLFGSVFFETEACFLGGFSSSGPETLGADNGVAIGGRGGLGFQYLVNDGLGVALQYRITGFSSEFSGLGTLDPTIDQAIITEIRQTMVLGLSYAL